MLTMNEKKAIKLRVLSCVADRILLSEQLARANISNVDFRLEDYEIDKNSEMKEYAFAFLSDCYERILDDLADV